MLMNDPTRELNEPINRKMDNVFLVLAILFMILCEALAIRGLWFKDVALDYSWKRYSLPLFIAAPVLLLSAFQMAARRWARQGQITSGLSARINSSFGAATMITYICILDLAELAFRAR